MFDLIQLEQLMAFAKYGTLSDASKQLHISQPALSRSMQKLEAEFGVSLFERSKNKIKLNKTGELAAEYAENIWNQSQNMLERLRAFEQSQRTITIGSCAPAPMWRITPTLSGWYPQITITSEVKENAVLIQGLIDDIYQVVITSEPVDIPDIICTEYCTEALMFALPETHPRAQCKELYLKDLDGESMLLLADIGFWRDLVMEKMPSSHFLVQDDPFSFVELIRTTNLPFFTTDLASQSSNKGDDRIQIPIIDPEASVTYYCACKATGMHNLSSFFESL